VIWHKIIEQQKHLSAVIALPDTCQLPIVYAAANDTAGMQQCAAFYSVSVLSGVLSVEFLTGGGHAVAITAVTAAVVK